jgi:hypothetical protein
MIWVISDQLTVVLPRKTEKLTVILNIMLPREQRLKVLLTEKMQQEIVLHNTPNSRNVLPNGIIFPIMISCFFSCC